MALPVISSVVPVMMASMFSAGAALLVATSASAPAASAPSNGDRMRIVRTAASNAAHDDAVAYLETERRRSHVRLASSDHRSPRRGAGHAVTLAMR